jgi:hypothetical protein
MTVVPAGDLPSLVVAVVGKRVRGSWWSHPRGSLIYALAEALGEAPDVLCLKLVEGKVTFVHRALWPALFRVASDPAFRTEAAGRLSPAARTLLRTVERASEVRFDHLDDEDRKRLSRARAELEQGLLIVSTSVHTEKGKHASLLRSWARWVDPGTAEAAAALAYEEARETLARACRGVTSALDGRREGRHGGGAKLKGAGPSEDGS